MNDYKKLLIDEKATIAEVIRVINDAAMQIALVVDHENRLLGTVTDGDIRRGLLNGLKLEDCIDLIIHRDALVVSSDATREIALCLMQEKSVSALPVLDSNRKVLGVYQLNQLLKSPRRENTLIIMAGGQGTRLRPYTENCPKPMLPIGGKPMLEHIITRAREEGFCNFVLSIHYLGNLIEDYFGDGAKFNVCIEYLREESPLGTAGALSLLTPLPGVPFVVTNGDVMSDIRYSELIDFHERHNGVATMAVRLHEWQHPFGVVKMQGVEITGFEEKPVSSSHINAGIYVLSPQALNYLNYGEVCDMPTLFQRLQVAGQRTIAYPMHEPWLDVGRPSDLEIARSERVDGILK